MCYYLESIMRRNLTRVLVVLSLLMFATCAAAADVVGRWKTIDDQTKQAKSIVEISRAADGTYTGRIVELLRPSRPNPNVTNDPIFIKSKLISPATIAGTGKERIL